MLNLSIDGLVGKAAGLGGVARKLRSCVLAAAVLAVSACGSSGGGPSSPPPEPPLPDEDEGGFTPDRELPVGFPALLLDVSPHQRRVASEEAARVSAMHRRGGTGKGETVGVFDSGVNSGHSDLRGQYAARCSMGLCNGTMGSDDDRRPELDRADHSPLHDIDGHGTSVLGVIAAKRNGVGVYGVAYDARVASYGNTAQTPWDDGTCVDCGFGARTHGWGGVFDKQTARGIDWMRSLGVRTINNSWGRTYPWSPDRNLTAAYIHRIMPRTLPAFQSYVDTDGVVVWGAGNSSSPNPDVEASLPKHFSDLEKGWLAVAALDGNGRIAGYSSHCGVAAAWCIAAPGEVVTPDLGGRWRFTAGTSIAAPYVTASLAALKSMFPNLSYQDVRKRILVTADRSAPYNSPKVYGQGRLDLDAASRPIGGTNFALGTLATGPIMSASGARVTLPREAIGRYLDGQTLVVLDNYQRAPFKIGLNSFAQLRQRYLSMNDLAPEPRHQQRDERDGRLAITTIGNDTWAHGLAEGHTFIGFGQGEGVMKGLAHLAGTPLPVSNYRMAKDAAGIALGFAGGGGGRWQAVAAAGAAERNGEGFGISGWNPGTVLAVSFAPNLGGQAPGADAFGMSFASDMHRPMGWEGSGALEVEGDSFEFAWKRNITAHEVVRVDLTNRLTHLTVRDGPFLRFDDALVGTVDLEASFRPHRFVTVAARFGAERPVSQVTGRIRAAAGVDESGRITYRDVVVDGKELMSFDHASLIVSYSEDLNASFNLGIAVVRDGFGETEALAEFRMDLEF